MTNPKADHLLLKRCWTSEEDAMIQTFYANTVTEKLLSFFPGRTLQTLRGRAFLLGVNRLHNPGNAGKLWYPAVDGMKICTACGENKPVAKFAVQGSCDGARRRNCCTTCEGRIAYARNPAKMIERARQYQTRYPEKARAHRLAAHVRRQTRLAGGKIAAEELTALFAQYDGKCAYCGDAAESVDHYVPLARGGKHEIGNLRPACLRCNRRKHALLPEQWAEKLAAIKQEEI